MTIPIKPSNVRIDKLMSGGSRYLRQKVIYYGDKNFLTFDTYLRPTIKLTGREKVTVITKGVEYRPDLVSYDVYGMPDAWWQILEANGIKDIFDFKAGRTIVLPDII